jgi:hypothetical protein
LAPPHSPLQPSKTPIPEEPKTFGKPQLALRTLLKILGEILGKLPNRANVADTLSPPSLIRKGKFVPTRDEDDDMIVNRSPLLELGNPEVDETPVTPTIIRPQSRQKTRDIPPVPVLVRSVGQRYASRVIPRKPYRDKLMP